jgi:hypothetical protein
MTALTAAVLRDALHYDSETGQFTWKSPRPKIRVGEVAGKIGTHGYRLICLNRKSYGAHRLAWLYVTGDWPEAEIDHINHDRLDNSFANLRSASRVQNLGNKIRQSNNKSGIKGVFREKRRNKWIAEIRRGSTRLYLGQYDDINHAAEAYRVAASKLYGEFAHSD